jgi:hypothetical protein
MCRGGERSGGVEKYRTEEGKDLEDGETEKWKGRKLSARGSEQQVAGDSRDTLLSPEMHLTDRKYVVGEDVVVNWFR